MRALRENPRFDLDPKFNQGRKKVILMLKNMLEARRANPNTVKKDFFDYVLEELRQNDTNLTEEIALDLMFVLLFANFETTAQAITVAIKFLTNNHRALKELTVCKELKIPKMISLIRHDCYFVQEEHEKILRQRKNPEAGLTWEEYKSMKSLFRCVDYHLIMIRDKSKTT